MTTQQTTQQTTIYTKSQVRAAILRAASAIEGGAPYDYSGQGLDGSLSLVEVCGPCMWGHIGLALGLVGEIDNMGIARAIGIDTTSDLYRLAEHKWDQDTRYNRALATRTMRKFADRYFPAEPQRAEGPLTIYDLLPLADWIADAQRAGGIAMDARDVESGVGA